jgi:hypothetical protein
MIFDLCAKAINILVSRCVTAFAVPMIKACIYCFVNRLIKS